MTDRKNTPDDLDAIRRAWQGMRVDNDSLDSAASRAADSIARGGTAPLQYRLARRQRRTALAGLLMIPLAYMLYEVLELNIWICVAYAVFGLVMSILNRLLADYTSEMPLAEMPVAEALRRAVMIRLRQRQIRIGGIIGGAAVLAALAVSLLGSYGSDMLMAMIIGLAAGLAVGIPRAVRMSRMARRLVESLHE
ncbi:MAG: hypothetical protein NC406_02765 [Bacteroides sp.]|nr:hypothetical protein [Bacteroides sp.]MCM1095694.1 hypothetical protein [Terasakiella sp.]